MRVFLIVAAMIVGCDEDIAAKGMSPDLIADFATAPIDAGVCDAGRHVVDLSLRVDMRNPRCCGFGPDGGD